MIPNQWYPIIESRRVRPDRPLGLRRLGIDLVLWRAADGHIACLRDRCAHRFAKLSRGRIAGQCIECPYHGIRYGGDGHATLVPVLGKEHPPPKGLACDVFHARESRDLVWLWYGRAEPSAELPWDAAIDDELGAAHAVTVEGSAPFPINYLRIMENATDLFHVAFVHRQFMGRFKRLEEFHCERQGTHIRVAGVGHADPPKPGDKGLAGRVHLFAPNLLTLRFTDKLGFIACATPIDEAGCWLFARYYNSLIRWPLIGRFVSWLMFKFDFWLLQKFQDLPVWQSQTLADPGDVSGYLPLKHDRGVIEYFRMRQELIEAAGAQAPRDEPKAHLPAVRFGRYGE